MHLLLVAMSLLMPRNFAYTCIYIYIYLHDLACKHLEPLGTCDGGGFRPVMARYQYVNARKRDFLWHGGRWHDCKDAKGMTGAKQFLGFFFQELWDVCNETKCFGMRQVLALQGFFCWNETSPLPLFISRRKAERPPGVSTKGVPLAGDGVQEVVLRQVQAETKQLGGETRKPKNPKRFLNTTT